MKRSLLLTFALCFGLGGMSALQAAISSATWTTSLTQPLYYGVPYTLVLQIKTQADEEIAALEIDQQHIQAIAQSTEVQGEHRLTRIVLEAPPPQEGGIELPEMHASAQLVRQQQRGFAFFRNSYTQNFKIPAYTIQFAPLPEAAKGLPCGAFELSFSAKPKAIKAGGVTILHVSCRAKEGRLPATLPFALEAPKGCKIYPFVYTKQTPTTLEARAYLVREQAETVKIALRPIQVFDTRQRAVTSLTAPAIILSALPEVIPTEEDLLLTLPGTAKTGMPLRYAPQLKAPILGVYERGSHVTLLEEQDTWARVSCDGGEGWIEKRFIEPVESEAKQ